MEPPEPDAQLSALDTSVGDWAIDPRDGSRWDEDLQIEYRRG